MLPSQSFTLGARIYLFTESCAFEVLPLPALKPDGYSTMQRTCGPRRSDHLQVLQGMESLRKQLPRHQCWQLRAGLHTTALLSITDTTEGQQLRWGSYQHRYATE